MKPKGLIMLKGLLCATALVGALATSSNAFANVVVNGDFSQGLSGWQQSGSGTTPGWGITVIDTTVSNATGFGDAAIGAYQGTTHAAYFVDDNAHEKLFQNLTLSANTQYTLSFGLFATTSGAGNPFSFTLDDIINEQTGVHGSFTDSVSITQVPVGVWTDEAVSFTTGNSKNYQLSFNFISGDTPAKDVLLSNVQIPEPTSMALLGLAALGMIAVSKRKGYLPNT
jgi:PEP-CTERM motif